MAKKKNNGAFLFNLISLIMIVAAIIFWFVLTPLKYETGGLININIDINYLNGTFGNSEKFLGQNVEFLKFSFLNLIPLVLLVIGGLVHLVGVLNPKAIKDSNLKLITYIVSLVGIVMLLMFKQFLIPGLKDFDFKEFKLTFEAFIIPVLLLGSSIVQFIKK